MTTVLFCYFLAMILPIHFRFCTGVIIIFSHFKKVIQSSIHITFESKENIFTLKITSNNTCMLEYFSLCQLFLMGNTNTISNIWETLNLSMCADSSNNKKSCVTCHPSPVTNGNRHSHRPSPC